jgi:hypothetical protein
MFIIDQIERQVVRFSALKPGDLFRSIVIGQVYMKTTEISSPLTNAVYLESGTLTCFTDPQEVVRIDNAELFLK